MFEVPELPNHPSRLFGLAKDPEVMAPTALSLTEVPQLYVPPAVGEPEEACWVNEVVADDHAGADVLACTRQFEGSTSAEPMPSKFCVVAGDALLSAVCATQGMAAAIPIIRWKRILLLMVPGSRRAAQQFPRYPDPSG